MNGCYELPVRHKQGSGGPPQTFFVATCSEIDSNEIWLKKYNNYTILIFA